MIVVVVIVGYIGVHIYPPISRIRRKKRKIGTLLNLFGGRLEGQTGKHRNWFLEQYTFVQKSLFYYNVFK